MDVEKHSQVHKWLTEIFGPNGVPEYEICGRTIDILHSVMKHNQVCDVDCMMAIADAKTRCVQYDTEAKRREETLKNLSVSPSSLPADVSGMLSVLVDMAQQLEVQRIDTASLSIGTFELWKKNTIIQNKLKRAELEVAKLSKKVSSIAQVSEQLEKSLMHALSEIESEEEKSRTYNETVNLLKEKLKEYNIENQNYETILSNNGFSTPLTHEELQKKNETLKSLRKEFDELKAKLDSYHDVPTDLDLLAEKVSVAKAQLKDLEDKLNTHYNMQ